MQHDNLLLEEPIRLASILEPSQYNVSVPALTKIVVTVGGSSRSVEILSRLLEAGMTAARFDFLHGDADYHQETVDNLIAAMRQTKKFCSIIFDTVGPEITIANATGSPVKLVAGDSITLSGKSGAQISSQCLPTGFPGLAKAAKVGDEIFVGQYLFTGSETTSVWLNVERIEGEDLVCLVKNSAVLEGPFFTVHATRVPLNRPTFSDLDKENLLRWGVRNKCDILSLSFTRSPEEIREARLFLSKLGELSQTHIYAKIESIEGLRNFDSILSEADGVILGRGNLGLDLPPEKVFLFQKVAVEKCNMAGKPVVISRVVDSMTDIPRPTRAEATDVANAVLDGVDAIMLGAETLRGLYPEEAVRTVGQICSEAEKVFNQPEYFRRMVLHIGEPMSDMESICSSAVRAAEKVRASCIVCFTSSGRAPKLLSKFKPSMPVLSVVIPRLTTNQLKWAFTGAFIARQSMLVRGLFPIMGDPGNLDGTASGNNESIMKTVLEKGRALGIMKPHDRVIVVQKLKDTLLVRIIELES